MTEEANGSNRDDQGKPWERHSSITCAAYLTNQETLDALRYWYECPGDLSASERKAELGSIRKDEYFVLVTEWICLWAEWMRLSSQTFREAAKVYLICAHEYPDVISPECIYGLRPTKDGLTAESIQALKVGMDIFFAIQAEMVAAKTLERIDKDKSGPLNPKAAAVLEILRGLPSERGMQGPEILDALEKRHIFIDQSTLTKAIIPALHPYGVRNKRGAGYFILSDRRKDATSTPS